MCRHDESEEVVGSKSGAVESSCEVGNYLLIAGWLSGGLKVERQFGALRCEPGRSPGFVGLGYELTVTGRFNDSPKEPACVSGRDPGRVGDGGKECMTVSCARGNDLGPYGGFVKLFTPSVRPEVVWLNMNPGSLQSTRL